LTFIIFVSQEQTTKSPTNLFSKPVFYDGKTVNYHTGQLAPKLRMLNYPVTNRNNFCTQGQNKFEQWQHFILVLFDWQIRNLVLLWSDMSSTAPSWLRFICNTWGLYMP